ncbi:MAG: STAS domain-containing protein [Streptosporangiaceae bacterium]|jgi:rsbT antagonist protein RsbS
MPVPILAQAPYLIASVQAALTDADLIGLQNGLLDEAQRRRCQGVIVDVTALDVMDSFSTRTLQSLAAMLRLRGVETVIAGIQPDVAMAMVRLGLTMPDVRTALDLDEGLAYLQAKQQGSAGRGQ